MHASHPFGVDESVCSVLTSVPSAPITAVLAAVHLAALRVSYPVSLPAVVRRWRR